MDFESLLAILAFVLVLLLFIVLNVKNFLSRKNTLFTIGIFMLTVLFALPAWYLIQYIVVFFLANTIPQNKIVNCTYLNETNCERRDDCQLFHPITTSGEIICVYKSSSK